MLRVPTPASERIPYATRAAPKFAQTPVPPVRPAPGAAVATARGWPQTAPTAQAGWHPTHGVGHRPALRVGRSQPTCLAQQLRQRGPAALNVGFHLRQRDPQLLGNLLVGPLLEVIQHQRHTITFGQTAQSALHNLVALAGVHVGEESIRYGKL